jgi:hypothetical protein
MPLSAGSRDSDVQCRDIVSADLKAMVEEECKSNPPLVVLHSCSPNQRAHEVDSLGRGLFSKALEQALVEYVAQGREVSLPGEAEARVATLMEGYLKQYRPGARQNPHVSYNRPKVVLIEGRTSGPPIGPSTALRYEKCPICHKWNMVTDTFECPRCQRDFVCLKHQSEVDRCCEECAKKLASERAEAKRKEAREEAARREEARRARQPKAGKPWENSLGMKFVPVPGTEVLFCIWETRVRDYAVYGASQSWLHGSWRNPIFDGMLVTPSEDCPVVCMTCDDASGFCAWLTGEERREGLLRSEDYYRLPTDAEWSWAVGIGDRESGTTPREKDEKLAGVYPWGPQWPPPPGSGNFADQSAKRKFSKWPIIDGYDDGYATTSPVGSFSANQHGLFDLAGNVWELCEDLHGNHDLPDYVLRGGSWLANGPDDLLSSYRNYRGAPGVRVIGIGFRVVLAGGSSR